MKTWKHRIPVLAVVAIALWLAFGGSAARAAEQDKDVPWEKIHQNTTRSFVIISYHLKKSDRPGL